MSTDQFPDFRLQREVPLPAIRVVAREFEHLPSGARLIHLATDDPENCFALAFATPPHSDDGVPHILEHAVLAGSARFPVREPFFEMVKSSPAGFINAMTSSVWTVYPICTTLERDFFNLAEVYADAVFYPQITRETFEREGHHLKLERPGDLASPLIRSGIVYNEMKGAYSNTEMVIHWRLKSKLFPGGALGHDSGGDPAAIPQLTWEALRAFHSSYYAPGNCFLLLYGDISLEKHLHYWGDKLSGLGRAPSLASRPRFEVWSAPRRLETSFAAEPNSDLSSQTFLSLRWHCGNALDRFEALAWQALSRLLSGHDGAPLKKALVDSKLGADVLEAGIGEAESELVFHVALKGSERERAEAFETLVQSTLEEVAATGFSPDEIETAFRQLAYSTLEVHSLFPLHLTMHLARYAACGADPLDAALLRETWEAVREQARTDATFLPRLIRDKLLANPHRLLTVFYPDPEHAAREEQRERDELAALKATLSASELQAIDEHAQQLEAAQGQPNSPEALATLPRLHLSDLPETPREIPLSLENVAGFPLVRNDVFSNGVVYLQAAVDVRDLPPHLWKFLPRYTDAFSKLGAAGQNWEQVAARRASVTGSLGSYFTAQLHAESGAPVVDLRFVLKTLDSDMDAALDLFTDLVFGLEAGDRARLHDMQTQGVAYYRSHLVNDALGAATVAAARSQSPVGWLNYLWRSPLTYAWMTHLTDDFDAHATELIEGIEAVRDFLRDRARWTWSFTGSDDAFQRTETRLSEWQARMSDQPVSSRPLSPVLSPGSQHWDGAGASPSRLGLAAPLDVQFCASVFPAPARAALPLVDLGFSLLQFDYFMPELRFKGNAYGGGGYLNAAEGTATFYSYRDPHLNETLSVFEGATAWAGSQQWTPEDLERALLGNVRDAVPAIRPAEATYYSLDRLRRGESAARRARDYQQKLNATPDAVHSALLNSLTEALPLASTVVAASRTALERANVQRSEQGVPPLLIEEMLDGEPS